MKILSGLLLAGCLLLLLGTVPSFSQDPSGVDTTNVIIEIHEVDEGFGGEVRIGIRLKTDNSGAGNDIAAVTLPLIITSSNTSANAVLDSSVSTTFGGSAVSGFDQIQHNVSSNGGDPSIFPLKTVLGAIDFGTGLLAGEHLFATLVFSVSETTTFCIDTVTIELSTLNISTSLAVDYTPYWQAECVEVTTYPNQQPPITIVAHSPVNLIVTDPVGDSIGIDFNTIAVAEYHAANDSIVITSSLPGEYTIKAVLDTADTSGDTSYSIVTRVDGYAPAALASNLPVPAEGEVHQAEITNNPDSGTVGCLSVPGDANSDGQLTLSDIISGVNYVFIRPGCMPLPICWSKGLYCRSDWNGDGSVTLADVIRGVNHLLGKPGGPWLPLATNECCLPIP